MRYSQTQLAQALGVSQGNIAKWENGKLKPPGHILALLARLAPEEESAWWLAQAGVKLEHFSVVESEDRTIPVLKDAAAAGTARVINDAEIDYKLNLPRHIVPRGGKLVGLKVKGDSMSPILEDGYIVLVDVSQRDPEKLIDRIVAASNGDGVTLKWLRRYEDTYMLVPQNASSRHPVRIIRGHGDWSIIGEVVKWIGALAPKRK